MGVDTLGHLLALHVTPANEQDCAQVAQLAEQEQDVTDASAEGASVDQAIPAAERSRTLSTMGCNSKWSNGRKRRKASCGCHGAR